LWRRTAGHLLLPLWLAQTMLHLATAAQRDAHERARAAGAPPDLLPVADLWGAVAEGMRELAPASPLLGGYEAAARAQRLHILTRRLPQPVLVADAPELQPAREAAAALTACLERLAAQVEQERESPLLLPLDAADVGPAARRSPLLCDVLMADEPAEVALSYLSRLAPMVAHSCAAALAWHHAAAMEPALAVRYATRDVYAVNKGSMALSHAYLRTTARCSDALVFAFYWDDAAMLEATLPAGGMEALGDRLGEATYSRSRMRTSLLYNFFAARYAQDLDPATPFEFDAAVAEGSLRPLGVKCAQKKGDNEEFGFPEFSYSAFFMSYKLLRMLLPAGHAADELSRVAPGCSLPRHTFDRKFKDRDLPDPEDLRMRAAKVGSPKFPASSIQWRDAASGLLQELYAIAGREPDPLAPLALASMLLQMGNAPAGAALLLTWVKSPTRAEEGDEYIRDAAAAANSFDRLMDLLLVKGGAGAAGALACLQALHGSSSGELIIYTSIVPKRLLLDLVEEMDAAGAPLRAPAAAAQRRGDGPTPLLNHAAPIPPITSKRKQASRRPTAFLRPLWAPWCWQARCLGRCAI
jgi:hypothetical protein